jgi:AraC family transcriptional regulator
MPKKSSLPIIDLEMHVPAGLTAVRRSHGWPGLFLQERRGHSGTVSYLGGPRQHVLYCFLKALPSQVILEEETRLIRYQAGECRFTPSGHSVEFSWTGEAQALVLGIEPWFLQGVAAELGITQSFPAQLNFQKLGAQHAAAVLLRQLGEELSASAGVAIVTESLARAIVVQLLREFGDVRPAKAMPAAPPVAVLRAVELMRQRLAHSLSLEEMAQASGVSPFHFARQFKAATGHPPHEYLMRLRVDHAQELIARQGRNWTLAAIAHESGFADQSHMSRHFRRVLGVTPGEFAEAQRGGAVPQRAR